MIKKILTEKKKIKTTLTNKERFLKNEKKCLWVRINTHR